MACQSSATLTQFGTVTSSSVSTSFSTSVTTLPDTTSTTVITSCLASASASGTDPAQCASSTVITSSSVIQGGVSTTSVPVPITVSFTTTTPTATLFAPCTTDNGNTSPDQNTTPPVSTPTDTNTTTTEVTTPTLTLTTSLDTTLANGQVTQFATTVTTTLPPSTAVFTTNVPSPTTQSNGTSGKSSGIAVGPIVGGVVGGFVGLIAIVGLLWYFCRRRPNWDDIFEKDYDEFAGSAVRPTRSRMLDMEDDPVPSESLANTEPKPYQYGLVGAGARTPPSFNSGLPTTPSSGGFPQNQAGPRPTAQLGGHKRTPSETPLMLNVQPGIGGQGQLLTPSSRSSTGSRPSTGGSYNMYPGAGPSSTGHGNGNMMMSNAPPPPRAPTPGAGAGPLGVSINTGPSLMDDIAVGPAAANNFNAPDSPTSIISPPRKLFVANQSEVASIPSPPGSPRPTSPGSPSSSNQGAGPSSFAGAMAGAYPTAADEKRRLQHNPSVGAASSVSTQSAYSQPSAPPSAYHGLTGTGVQRATTPESFTTARAQSPRTPQAGQSELAYLSDPEEVPTPTTTRTTQRRTSQGVIVHRDAGHIDPGAPPAYTD